MSCQDQICEQIFAHKLRLVIQSPAGSEIGQCLFSRRTAIRPAGFASNQALLPPAPHGFEGYRLLREYFVFPQRFSFFELAGFQ